MHPFRAFCILVSLSGKADRPRPKGTKCALGDASPKRKFCGPKKRKNSAKIRAVVS